jgi:hypothetical protein
MLLARRSYLKCCGSEEYLICAFVDDTLEFVRDVAIEVAELHANFVSALSFQI